MNNIALLSLSSHFMYLFRMSNFRMSLVVKMMSEFLYSLQEQGAGLERDTEQVCLISLQQGPGLEKDTE